MFCRELNSNALTVASLAMSIPTMRGTSIFSCHSRQVAFSLVHFSHTLHKMLMGVMYNATIFARGFARLGGTEGKKGKKRFWHRITDRIRQGINRSSFIH